MPSRRMIDPSFWASERMAKSLTREQRLTFIGIFSNADDQGRMKGNAAFVRSRLYPYDDIPLATIEAELEAVAKTGSIVIYEVDGIRYLQIVKWWQYQHPRWAWPSEYPAPPGWIDRHHYRRGNDVIKSEWDDDDPNADFSMEPEWNQSGTDAEPAPSTSTRISGRTRTSGSDTYGANAPQNPQPDANYQEIRRAWIALFPDKPKPRENNKTLVGKARTRMRSPHFAQNWRAALERASCSTFLHKGGFFDLGWFMDNDQNYEKCLNGNYDDKTGNGRASPRADPNLPDYDSMVDPVTGLF